MTKKIYVGTFPFSTTEDDLSALFQEIGHVESVSIITDRDTGRSKGFGFITMDDADAEKAIDRFHGQDFNGRALTVNEARPMVKRESSDRNYR